MKKIFSLFLVLVTILALVLSLSSCGSQKMELSKSKTSSGAEQVLFVDIGKSALMKMKAGDTLEVKILTYVDGELDQVNPGTIICSYDSDTSSPYSGESGKSFDLYPTLALTVEPELQKYFVYFKYNFEKSCWESSR